MSAISQKEHIPDGVQLTFEANDICTLADEINKRLVETESSEVVIARLVASQERQRIALDEERNVLIDNRQFLEKSLKILIEKTKDICSKHREETEALKRENENLRVQLSKLEEAHSQPGPPLLPHEGLARNLADPQMEVTSKQTSRDMALAMLIQEEEEESLESDSETDSGPEIPPKSQESGAKRLWAAVAGSSSSSSSSSASDPTKYRSKIRELTKQLEQAISGYHRYEQKYRREQQAHQLTWRGLGDLDLRFNNARRKFQHQEEEIYSTKFELQNVKQQLSDAVNLCEVRGKELKGAQVFLPKADTLSTSDVVQKVGDLNEEVFLATALLGKVLVYDVYGEDVDCGAERKKAIEENHEKAVWMLGDYLFGILAEQPANPLLVQIVIQSALTKWCSQVVEKWQPDNTSASELIGGIYDNIRTSEDQAVAGRWRSLTRAHLHYSTSAWTTNILEGILSVINVAGWARPPQSDIEQFEKRLASIFKAIQDVRKATGEDVTSADLEVAIIEANADFEPAWMEDAYGDERASKGKQGAPEKVVSTSGLGLKRIVIKRPQKGPISKTAEMLSFPKVVLEKTVKEAMEPPPPSKGKGGNNPAGAGGGIMSFIGIS